jgi:hypothetical protein
MCTSDRADLFKKYVGMLERTTDASLRSSTKTKGRKASFENIFRLLGLDHGKMARHFFMRRDEMTEDDKMNERAYEDLYSVYLKRVPPAVKWRPGPNDRRFVDKNNITRNTFARTIELKLEEVRKNHIPASIRIWTQKKKPRGGVSKRNVEKRINLKTWMPGNDSLKDVRQIAAAMRGAGIVVLSDARSVQLGARALLRIREVLARLTASVAPLENRIRSDIAIRRELNRLRNREPCPDQNTVCDNGFEQMHQSSERPWWSREIWEMTRKELVSIMNQEPRKALLRKYRRNYHRPRNLASVARRCPEEWSEVMMIEARYKSILLRMGGIDTVCYGEWDKLHEWHVMNADSEKWFRRAVEKGDLPVDRLRAILEDYPDIAVLYPPFLGPRMTARERTEKLGLDLSKEYCESYDDAFLGRDAKAMAMLLDHGVKSRRRLFVDETGLVLPDDKKGIEELLEEWAR